MARAAIALLIIGVVLLTMGALETESFSSDLSRLFTGEPTDKALWMLLAGTLATLVGLGGLVRGSKGSKGTG